MNRCFWRRIGLLWALIAGLLLASVPTAARDVEARGEAGVATISLEQLPAQARETLRLIHAGGPFSYARDGITFGNRERLLPRKPGDYYREYTVPTPGARDRGARRIIAGRGGEMYYTDDHYRSFRRILE
jgi:ribonuclease T1